jgi:2-keto-4-pentenoate hydratase/2-oxohepta-3-ene-1,7-dioic acid hydratase in catechol pathway
MRLCQFNDNHIGVVEDDVVRDVSEVLDTLRAERYPFSHGDALIRALPKLRCYIEEIAREAPAFPLANVSLCSPVANPGKLVAAPVNYLRHLEEVRENQELHHQQQINQIHRAGLFLKATSSLIGASQSVHICHPGRRTDHEVELAVVIGYPCKNVTKEEALLYVAGYCIGLDITIRGPEERSLRKSADTYSVLGPWMVTSDELGDPSQLDLLLEVNGEVRQRANTRDLILGVPELIAFASSFYELYPGDVIFTGTPEGVGQIVPGDEIYAKIEKIGEMTIGVEAE